MTESIRADVVADRILADTQQALDRVHPRHGDVEQDPSRAPHPDSPHVTASAGVTGPAFYVDGEPYRTVNTPTDVTDTGAPDHSFDVVFPVDGATNVATAAPGDTGVVRSFLCPVIPLPGR